MKRADWLQHMHEADSNDPEYITAGLLVDINARFLLRMQEVGVTQRQLAEKLGVSQPYISKALNLSKNISIGTIVALAHALDLEVRAPEFIPKEKSKPGKTRAARQKEKSSKPHPVVAFK